MALALASTAGGPVAGATAAAPCHARQPLPPASQPRPALRRSQSKITPRMKLPPLPSRCFEPMATRAGAAQDRWSLRKRPPAGAALPARASPPGSTAPRPSIGFGWTSCPLAGGTLRLQCKAYMITAASDPFFSDEVPLANMCRVVPTAAQQGAQRGCKPIAMSSILPPGG